jgi:hypothetical protein
MSDASVDDAIALAQRALARVSDLEGRLGDVEDALEEQGDDLTALSLRVEEVLDEDPDYETLGRAEKVGLVREHAFRKAARAGTRRATIDYNAVMWEVFDGEPSESHCYTLLRRAAGYDGETDTSTLEGFEWREPDGENNHLAVDADAAKAARDVLSAKNRGGEAGVL